MDSTNANVTEDQELAKVLEGMNQQATAGAPVIPTTDDTTTEETPKSKDATAPETDDTLTFEETPQPEATPAEAATADGLPPGASYTLDPEPVGSAPVLPVEPSAGAGVSPELDAIKKDALEELRPLVDKLDLPADEKFDTLLLIIRSTDDKSLVGAAHDAARAIEDEAKRAQALLDVIKEIDYFSGHGQQPQ